MSLLNRLLISITVLVACVLAGTLMLSIGSARTYLDEQLTVQGENAATSLALLLSQQPRDNRAARELLMSALFDTGQFSAVRFSEAGGDETFSRTREPEHVNGSPAWFDAMVPLSPARASRDISAGWQLLGTVTIEVDDSSARQMLWFTSLRLFGFVLLAGVFWGVFAVFLVRWLRRALAADVAASLAALHDKSGMRPEGAPALSELRDTELLFSEARERVMATENELESRIETLTLTLNQDGVTGLANRRYFINELRRALAGEKSASAVSHGHVFIARIRNLSLLSQSASHEALDVWLRGCATRLKEVFLDSGMPRGLVGRLNGSDFAALAPLTDGPQATQLAQRARASLLEAGAPSGSEHAPGWAFALIDFASGAELAVVLSRLDYSLMQSEIGEHGEVEYASFDAAHPGSQFGGHQWREVITEAIRTQAFVLEAQRHRFRADELIEFFEAHLTMELPGHSPQSMSSSFFMPPAVRLGLSPECDMQAIRLAAQWLRENNGDLVVPFSTASVVLATFRAGLVDFLETDVPLGLRRRLIIEIDAAGLLNHAAELREFANQMHDLEVGIGLRRLGVYSQVLDTLNSIPVTYVKLDTAILHPEKISPDSLRLIEALVKTATQRQFRVIATGFADTATMDSLRDHHIFVPE